MGERACQSFPNRSESDTGFRSQPCAPHVDFRRAREVTVAENLTFGLVDFHHSQLDGLLPGCPRVRIGHRGGRQDQQGEQVEGK